jgi:hypothetical protein
LRAMWSVRSSFMVTALCSALHRLIWQWQRRSHA